MFGVDENGCLKFSGVFVLGVSLLRGGDSFSKLFFVIV